MASEKKTVAIPGTRISFANAQVLVSTGINALDDLIGGGLAVGTLCLLEEDGANTTYSKVMLRYFLAEGVACGHSLFVSSDEDDGKSLISSLPAINMFEEPEVPKPAVDEKMAIAWRYQDQKVHETKFVNTFAHTFDLSTPMDPEKIKKCDIEYWQYNEEYMPPLETFRNRAYHNLLESIKRKIDDGFSLESTGEKKILRIGLNSLGSPLWYPTGNRMGTSHLRDLDLFIFCLRAILRSSYAVAVLTVPSKLIDKESMSRCVYSSDTALKLLSFSGTELDKNKSLSDYHGFFQIIKVPAINTLASKEIGPNDYAFKLRRKKFIIEELHLPPDLGNSNEISSMSCGGKHSGPLDF